MGCTKKAKIKNCKTKELAEINSFLQNYANYKAKPLACATKST
jgi:t-SNARE complex subunit (syntaxin)